MWSTDPERLELRAGGGLLIVAGGLVAAVGVMLLWQLNDSMASPTDRMVALPLGIGFVALGLLLAFARSAIVLDRRQGMLRRWWGLLGPWIREARPLGDFDMVEVSVRISHTRYGVERRYPVVLLSDAGDVRLRVPTQLHTARVLAERVSDYLGIGLREVTGGAPVERAPGRLHESVRERLQRDGIVPQWPTSLPAHTHLKYERVGDSAVITLPARGVSGAALGALALGVGVAVLMFALMAMPGESPAQGDGLPQAAGVILFLIGLLALGAGLGTALVISQTSEQVTVSPWELQVERLSPIWPRRWRFAADALEVLQCDASAPRLLEIGMTHDGRHALLAESDEQRVVFGGTVSGTERQWVYDVILYVVCGSQPE